MKPYYQSGDVTLYHGDCLTVLPALAAGSVAAVVTSPPYAMQRKATYGGIPEADYPAWTVAWLAAVPLADNGSVLINIKEHRNPDGMTDYVHRTRLAVRAAGWSEVDEIIWVKPNAPPVGANWLPRQSWERVLWFARCPRPWCDPKDYSRGPKGTGQDTNIWARRCGLNKKGSYRHPEHPRFPNVVSVPLSGEFFPWHHPGRFPTPLPTWLIPLVCPEGGTALDPFFGSGTTAVACLRTGRKFVGVELSEPYCEIAAKRVEAETREALPACPP